MLRQFLAFGVVLLMVNGESLEFDHLETSPYDHVLWQNVATVDLGECAI